MIGVDANRRRRGSGARINLAISNLLKTVTALDSSLVTVARRAQL